MNDRFERTVRVIGDDKFNKLNHANILVFGIGGVGGHCVEALARMGVGHITVVDGDVVDRSNINRQLIATEKNIGLDKVKVIKSRLLDINPDIDIKDIKMMYLPENRNEISFDGYDYIVDAIDNVTAKLDIICRAKEKDIPVISSMGTGNKLEPTMLEVSDISKTSVCPLAKVIRKELRKRGVKEVKVVYSKEEPIIKSSPPGSVSFVPPVAGMIIAGEVIKDIIQIYK